METLRSRLKWIAKGVSHFIELGAPSEQEIRSWIEEEMGGVDRFDRFQKKGDRLIRAIAPERLLVVGAGNLAVSLWQSLLVGFILGSSIWVKPGSGTEKELHFFLKRFPISLRRRVTVLKKVPTEILKLADAVVVLGSDETIEVIQKSLHPKQRWVAYGHRTSAIWVGTRPKRSEVYDQIVQDICLYQQQGCLSPRWIWLAEKVNAFLFLEELVQAMDRWSSRNFSKKGSRGLTPTQEVLIYELRETHRALGNKVYASVNTLDWTVIFDEQGSSELSDLPRVIFVRGVSEKDLMKEFAWMMGDLSTVGIYGGPSESLESIWFRWGASRICSVGEMQRPPLNWFHDGRPQISDLVRWVEKSAY